MNEGARETIDMQAQSVPGLAEYRETGSSIESRDKLLPSYIIDRARFSALAEQHQSDYQKARPYPHVILDGLFYDSLLDAAIHEMPAGNARWNTYNTSNEHKHVCSDFNKFGPTTEILMHALNSAAFVSFLEKLTGIKALIPDPSLYAAGYMRCDPSGFLNLHTDFATHSYLKLDRRINVLLYLNRDWRPEWGGQLELHSDARAGNSKHHEVVIEPLFNRMVIFNTPNALHGHPRPVACPPGRARLCLSWYYYTAPPVLGYWSRVEKVHFVGKRQSAKGMLIRAGNEILPPVVFRALRALRDRYKGTQQPDY